MSLFLDEVLLATFNKSGQCAVSSEATLDSGLMKKSPLCWIS